ncbi:ABC transporter ATP-binding protein [Spiroplasma monobiae]|uniref:ABC transporter ATP-binding protein n=1 Tax=Spiroplasma monobiae MQ-1 TaxID=1336748 RepID=A0A2K9LUK2_SPISQ|nr:ABC transporter ATP-binding protein [Spiroplasma monobiae]AUM62733.1 ABC transporter ATP-binding protein [Spiroplasma monobiae MQ-1]
MQTIIDVKNISKSFGKKIIFKDFSLEIKEGQRVALMGANGCGKTTLVEMIAQFSKPDSGEIKINLQNNIKQEIGIQLQEGSWPNGITAQNMLDFYKSVYPKFTKEWEEKLKQVFEIEEFINRPLKKLSGGQRQRFNAMISIMNNPKIVILDELTTGLDMELQFKIIDFFKVNTKEFKQTLLLVSHHPEEVEEMCDRLIIIKDSKVWYDDSVENTIKNHNSVRELMNRFFKGENK